MLSDKAGCEIMTREQYDLIRVEIRNTYVGMGHGAQLDMMAMTDELFVRTFKSRLEIVEEYATAGQLLPSGYKWHEWEVHYSIFFYFKFYELRQIHGTA